jgi:protocatechuate 3,4-dioxygenase beta subunit
MLTILFDGVATREGGEEPVYRFDIRVQGEPETVFFDI